MKMMEFGELEQGAQLDILQKEGAFIGKLKKEKYTTLLYQLADFYVEVIYTSHRFEVYSLRYTDGTDILEPYLPQIKF